MELKRRPSSSEEGEPMGWSLNSSQMGVGRVSRQTRVGAEAFEVHGFPEAETVWIEQEETGWSARRADWMCGRRTSCRTAPLFCQPSPVQMAPLVELELVDDHVRSRWARYGHSSPRALQSLRGTPPPAVLPCPFRVFSVFRGSKNLVLSKPGCCRRKQQQPLKRLDLRRVAVHRAQARC